jgi:hypothetical protein
VSARRAARLLVLIAPLLAGLAREARPAVRVEQDEVIFTLRAPGAREVYLVGDFNQWNPTVERMNEVDGLFEVGLFLVAGEYRYKFVVDGALIVDPDNPGGTPEAGSPLKVVERGGGLVLSTELAGEAQPAPRAGAGVRYIGALRSDDADSDVEQRVDLSLRGRYDRLDARAVVATHDSSWTLSPASIDAFFDRGRVTVRLQKFSLTGLENDSSWASSDPTTLVGRAGVYGYDAGFRRHGVAAEAAGSHLELRAFYADATPRAPRTTASVSALELAGFAAGSAADTSVYAANPTFDNSDVLAAEAVVSFGRIGAGFAHRSESGVNPGVSATAVRDTVGFVTTTLATTERRAVSVAWLRHDDVFGLRVTGAYGWGGNDTHASGAGTSTGDLSGGIDAADATEAADITSALLDTRRGWVEVAAGGALGVEARWDYTSFDVDPRYGSSAAHVHRIALRGFAARWGWTGAASAEYTDADYDGAPDALTIDGTELNPWLSMWDAYDVPAIVGLALGRCNVVTVCARRDSATVAGGMEGVLETEGVADDLVHASARADLAWSVHDAWIFCADVRAAWYDGARWAGGGTRWSTYVEAGWRRGPFWITAGVGLDPWVFDPVISDYADIGRSEFLRTVLSGGVRRSRADAIVTDLIERERALEEAGVFKLECVIDLP